MSGLVWPTKRRASEYEAQPMGYGRRRVNPARRRKKAWMKEHNASARQWRKFCQRRGRYA